MPFTTLISPQELYPHLNDPEWAIIDCRFSLADPEIGHKHYLEGHIPGAVYAHLNRDLSAKVVPGLTGRHPLPSVEEAGRVFSSFGIGPDVQVVVYDDVGGALAAGRLWWMLKWLGHEQAAVLDGGWQAWIQAGYPVWAGEEQRIARQFSPQPHPELVVNAEQVEAMRLDPGSKLVDVRTSERYRGEKEPIDPIAGHIPGAVNMIYLDNLAPDGCFRSKDELRDMYRRTLGDIPADKTVFYCGSGVTSVLNVLAMEYAGLGRPKLYVGSWSEWITNPLRSIERTD